MGGTPRSPLPERNRWIDIGQGRPGSNFGNGGEGRTAAGTVLTDMTRGLIMNVIISGTNYPAVRTGMKAFRTSALALESGDHASWYKGAVDASAEREGRAMKRHRKLTAKHRRIVYRHAGIADPRP